MKSYQVVGLLILGFFLYLLISLGLMGCWNGGVSPAFNLPQIDFTASVYLTGFVSLISLLFTRPNLQKQE